MSWEIIMPKYAHVSVHTHMHSLFPVGKQSALTFSGEQHCGGVCVEFQCHVGQD